MYLYIFDQYEQLVSVLAPHSAVADVLTSSELYFVSPLQVAPSITVDNDGCPFFQATEKNRLNGESKFQFGVVGSLEGAKHVIEGNLVAYLDSNSKWQMYEIVTIDDVHEGSLIRTAYCENYYYELRNEIVTDISLTEENATAALTAALINTRWTVGTVSVSGNHTITMSYGTSLELVYKIVEAWNCDVSFEIEITNGVITNRYVNLVDQLGSNNGKLIVYSKDIKNIKRVIDISQTFTAAYGFGKTTELENSQSVRADFSSIVWAKAGGDPADKPAGQKWVGDTNALALWGKKGMYHRFCVFETSEESDADDLLQKTWNYLQTVNTPKVSYTVNAIALDQLGVDYSHEKVSIGDTVHIIDRSFVPELLVSARVVEITRDYINGANTAFVLDNFVQDTADRGLSTEATKKTVENRLSLWDRSAAINADGTVNTSILNGLIDTLQIANEAVTAAKIAVKAITEAKIDTAAITEAKIAVGAITSTKIGSEAVSSEKIAASAIVASKIATDAVTSEKIVSAAISEAKLAAGAVTSNILAANAVIAGKIAADAVTATTIATGAITAGKIAANAVEADAIKAGAVVAGKIAANAVVADTIAASAITADKIVTNAVTADKILAGSVSADKIAASAVSAEKIAASAITADKIATGAITAGKIYAGAIAAADIAAEAITSNHISASGITADKVTAGSLLTQLVKIVSNGGYMSIDGNALRIYDATNQTNLLTYNQSTVESGTYGFTGYNATLTKDTTYKYQGAASLKVVTSASVANAGVIFDYIDAYASTAYSVAVRLLGGSGSEALYLRLRARNASGADLGASSNVSATLTTAWQEFKLENYVTPANTARLEVEIVAQGSSAYTFYYDAGQLEKAAGCSSWVSAANLKVAMGQIGSGNYGVKLIGAEIHTSEGDDRLVIDEEGFTQYSQGNTAYRIGSGGNGGFMEVYNTSNQWVGSVGAGINWLGLTSNMGIFGGYDDEEGIAFNIVLSPPYGKYAGCTTNFIWDGTGIGPVLKAPSGQYWRIKVDNSGVLSTVLTTL